MATIAGFKRRFEQLYGTSGEGVRAILSDEVGKTSQVIVDLNRDQLLYGRNAKGKELAPSILDDPYWNDKGGIFTAKNYMLDKVARSSQFNALKTYTSIQLFSTKNMMTPNLIHSTGSLFFNHFFISVNSDSYTIGSSGMVASDIESKYNNVYGLAPASRRFYYRNWLRVALWNNIIKHLGK